MTSPHFHILNGDALHAQIPAEINGERIVMRECLLDGDVGGDSLETFYNRRATFFHEAFAGHSKEDYQKTVVPEFEKMRAVPDGSEVNLWFEDDLFCQVNFWFVAQLLSDKKAQFFLVRPPHFNQYGFGGLDTSALLEAYNHRHKLSDLSPFVRLWDAFKGDDRNGLYKEAKQANNEYPFLLPAVVAHLDRFTKPLSRPEKVLKEIMKDLDTREFGLVFREFCKREPVYGFGDLQVKRMYDRLVD